MFRSSIKTLALTAVLGAIPIALPVAGFGQDRPASDQAQPDNTKMNKRDRKAGEPTADQQKENKSDREVARQIRRSLVKDKSLSTYAHNIKVIAQDGTVTLKGPVRSEEEKHSIETMATQIAGKTNVKNELSVASGTDADRSKK